MEGYDKDSTGLEADWGACHTTWFNPVKYGYACKIIATVEVTTVDSKLSAEVRQHVIGSIDLPMEQQFFGTMLVNQEEWVEETDDPYNINEESNFNNVVNKNLRTSMNALPVSVATGFYLKMLSPDDWTDTNYNLYYECTGNGCEHPFYVKKQIVGETYTWKICTGMVNNIIPGNIDNEFELTNGFFYLSATVSGENYPVAVQIYSGSAIPADGESASFIGIARIVEGEAQQLISSSLWTERFKCGSKPAKYWWSNV
jgi:hypothetical protein